jgi:serine/threonine-protein kinase
MSVKLEEGTVFASRYRIVRCFASGGMGAVYEVIHLETNRRRALKVMHPHLFQSEEMRARFKLEARIAAEVDSEYIVDVSDAGVDEATQTPFLVMELLRGEELGDRLKRMGRLPPEEVVMYMQQTAWALDRTHAASIVHRDLKPANLFLTTREDGTPRIKILDFGVAKLVAEGATAAGATRSLGTPLYMAPEQFRANTKLTAAADIHALTLMTYTLLVGEAYWAEEASTAGDVIAFAMLVVHGHPEPPVRRAARRGVTLPPGFDAWFAKGAASDPAERFPTASEAIRALRGVGGPTNPGVAPVDMRPATASNARMVAPENRLGLPINAMLERATTSTGASAMTAAPASRRRASLVAAAAVLGLTVLGTGAWLALRHGRVGADASNQAVPVVSATTPTASIAAPAAVHDPLEVVTSAGIASVAPSESVVVPSSNAVVVAPSIQATVEVRPPPRVLVPSKKQPPSAPRLGRDN